MSRGRNAQDDAPRSPAQSTELTASLRRLKRGAVGALLVQVLGAGLGIFVHLAVARLIGQAEYGVYALALSWVSVLAVIAQLGQDTNVVRFLPVYAQNGEWGKARGMRRALAAIVFVPSLTIAAIGSAIVYLLGAYHGTGWVLTFCVALVIVPVLTQAQQNAAVLRALRRAVMSGAYINVVRPLAMVILLGLIWLFTPRLMSAPVAMAASATAALVAVVASATHVSFAWPSGGKAVQPRYELRKWVTVGTQLSLLSIVLVARNRVDVLLLGGLTSASGIAAYYAAVQVAGLALYGLTAVNVVLAPMISERYAAGDLAGLQVVARRGALLAFLGAVLVSVVFALMGKWALGLFGAGFRSAYIPLLVLLVGNCLVCALGEVGLMLALTRYQKQAAAFVIAGLAVNCIATLVLVPRVGAVGAAIGAVLSILTWRLLSLRFVINTMGINPSIWGRPYELA